MRDMKRIIMGALVAFMLLETGVAYADDEWEDFILDGNYYCNNGEVLTFFSDFTACYTGVDNCEVTWDWGQDEWTVEVYFDFEDGTENVLNLDIHTSEESGYTLISKTDDLYMSQNPFGEYALEAKKNNKSIYLNSGSYETRSILDITPVKNGTFAVSYYVKDWNENKIEGVLILGIDGDIRTEYVGYGLASHYGNLEMVGLTEIDGVRHYFGDYNGNIIREVTDFLGNGYAYIYEEESGFDEVVSRHIFLDPYGNEIARKERDEIGTYVEINGFGNGFFSYANKELFSAKAQKWIEMPVKNGFQRLGSSSPFGIKFNTDPEHILFLDNYLQEVEINIPEDDGSRSGIDGRFTGSDRQFITFGDNTLYNIEEDKTYSYNGKYLDKLPINNDDVGGIVAGRNIAAIELLGADGKEYSLILDVKDMSERCEPILGRVFYICDDYIVLSSWQVYDCSGNMLINLNDYNIKKINCSEEGIVVLGSKDIGIYTLKGEIKWFDFHLDE